MPDDLEPLLYWCHERESIRARKLDGMAAPWTTDPILATYRFCNLHRRNDRVSAWLLKNVLIEKNIKYDLRSFLMFAAWCRWVNWPPTIKAVLDAGLYPKKRIDWKKIGKLVDQLGKSGKVWTGAYMIRAPKKGQKKGRFVAETVVGKNFKAMLPKIVALLAEDTKSYQEIWAVLQTIDGYGSFMAGQIAGDLTYTPLLRTAIDLQSWAPMGPGSIRGFNRIIGNSRINQKPSEELWSQKLIEWRAAIIERLGPEYEDLTTLDVQNSLCEISKYLAVKTNTGRMRARYRTHSEFYTL